MATDQTTTHHAAPRLPIVVGVDGSPSSLDALRWAVRQGSLTGSAVHAVIAWHYPAVYGMYAITDALDWAVEAEQTLASALKEALGDEVSNVTSYVHQGHPARVLLDAAAGADLLVVGSRGHGGFAELLLVSVSEQVVTHATCPVLVVHHRVADDASDG